MLFLCVDLFSFLSLFPLFAALLLIVVVSCHYSVNRLMFSSVANASSCFSVIHRLVSSFCRDCLLSHSSVIGLLFFFCQRSSLVILVLVVCRRCRSLSFVIVVSHLQPSPANPASPASLACQRSHPAKKNNQNQQANSENQSKSNQNQRKMITTSNQNQRKRN